MATPPIIASFIRDFAVENDLSELSEDKQFEHLLAWLLFEKLVHGRLVTGDVVTGPGETGIDGTLVVLDGNLILTAEDAEEFFQDAHARLSSSVVAELHFFQAKLSQSFKRDEILGFGEAVVELLGSDEPATPQDDYLLEVRRIYFTLTNNASKLDLERAKCRLSFCSLGEWQNPAHPAAAMRQTEGRLRSLEFFGRADFVAVDRNEIRGLWNAATRRQEATLPTIARFPFPAMPGIDNAVVALVRASAFVDSVIRDDSGSVRLGIFDQNIRDFEGVSNDVNTKMRETLQSNSSRPRFGVMNNGVTVIAKEMNPAADSYVLRDYQIVNGCQTSNVLEKNRDALTDDVLLQVKLIQTTSPDVLNDVVEATNSQTQVPREQFIANNKMAVETYEFFRAYPEDAAYRLYFERRKSELSSVPGISNTRMVTIQDLARTFGAIFLEAPHLVASAPNQAFSNFKDRLFLDEHNPIVYYTAAFAHYRLFLLKQNSRLRIPQHRLYWHVLTCAKRIAAGRTPPLSDHRKLEAHCKQFLGRLWQPTDALALFEEAQKAIANHTSQIDRDRLRRQAFSNEYLSAL